MNNRYQFTSDQLDLRAAPHLRSIGEIVTHMIGGRARWFHELIGEGDSEFAALGTWDRKGMPVRSAAELVNGLEITLSVMHTAIARWTPAEWAINRIRPTRESQLHSHADGLSGISLNTTSTTEANFR